MLLAVLGGLGCVTSTGAGDLKRQVLSFDAPPATAPGWRQVKTADFVLFTDLDAADAERAAQLLAQSLVGLKAMFGRAPVLVQRRLTVIALRDGMEFERRYGKRTWGFAFTEPEEVTLCLYGPPDRWFVRTEINYEGTQSVLQHELAHAIISRYFPRQPKWFAEGMAQYLETYRWLDGDTVQLGEPNLDAYRAYREYRSLNIQDMLAWDSMNQREATVAGLYGLSWAFVHYARNSRTRELAQYMAMLAEWGPERAWRQVFAPVEGALDGEVFRYMKVGQYTNLTIKLPPTPPAPAAVEALSGQEQVFVQSRLDAMERAMKARE